MTISKETGTKMVKIGLYIVTPTVILLVVLGFLYWRKQKKKKLAELNATTLDANTITKEPTPLMPPEDPSKSPVVYQTDESDVVASSENVTDESSKPKIEKIA